MSEILDFDFSAGDLEDLLNQSLPSSSTGEKTSQIDEYASDLEYEKYIVLNKKDLSSFCRLVDPLTKSAVDLYGKSVKFSCVNDEVQVTFLNRPLIVQCSIPNRSGKTVADFIITVETLKKLVSQAYASLILVEDENGINLLLCEQLLFLQTQPLDLALYNITPKETAKELDPELAQYAFRRVSQSLSLTDRASERNIAVKGGSLYYNTGSFMAKVASPFAADDSFVVGQTTAGTLATFTDLSKASIQYQVYGSTIALRSEGFYAELNVSPSEKVDLFISPNADFLLSGDATAKIMNDNLIHILTVVRSLDYLSNFVTIGFTYSGISLKLVASNNQKSSTYDFPLLSGAITTEGEMRIAVDTLKLFLAIAGQDCSYNFTDSGLSIATDSGRFLLKKS